jgi:spindle assembly abnormal protein 6
MDTNDTHVVSLPLRSEGRTRTVEMRIEYAEKDLVVTMSDPCDPVFLYYLRIDDASFLRIKQAQSLLVDFPRFPSMLVDLLRRSNGLDGSFFANLAGAESNSPSLRIVETNAFRQIIHLDLNLVPASDSTIKQHLSDLCLKLKVFF